MVRYFYAEFFRSTVLMLILAVGCQCNRTIKETNHDKFDISQLNVNKYRLTNVDDNTGHKFKKSEHSRLTFDYINEYANEIEAYNDMFKRSADIDMTSDEAIQIHYNETNTNRTGIDLHEKLVNIIEFIENSTKAEEEYYTENSTLDDCVGVVDYCNMTEKEYMDMLNDYIFPQPYEWVLIATHAIVFVIGLIGNALVCVAVYRNHSMRTVTNYFIVNLAVADFMVILFCLPPTVLWDVTETWFFGNVLCRIILYFQLSERHWSATIEEEEDFLFP